MTDLTLRPSTKVVFHDVEPQVVGPHYRTWITRGGNFAVCISEVEPGAILEREDEPEEVDGHSPAGWSERDHRGE